MDLTKLQLELRSIKNHIELLHSEIEKMKPKTDDEKKSDFDKITKMAKQYPIKNATIKSMPDFDKKKLINSLAYLLSLEQSNFYSRLLYINRLAFGVGLDFNSEDIYKNGLEFEINDIYNLCIEFEKYKHTYLVEAFITANIAKDSSLNMLNLIADISNIMKIDKEELRVIATVAKSVLQNNSDILLSLPLLSKNRFSNCFRDYISKDWIALKRIKCASLCITEYYDPSIFLPIINTNIRVTNPCIIKESLESKQTVKKGDILAIYYEKTSNIFPFYEDKKSEVEKKVISPSDGVVYFVHKYVESSVKGKDDEFLEIYVTSYFDDYKKFSNK